MLPNADFTYNSETKKILMSSTGTYSFSVIALNTTCELAYSESVVFTNKHQ